MKFSENWLRIHVPIQASRDELAATLTAIGLEVEEVTPLGEALGQVVVARIVEAVRHPEADRLQVCSVDAGQGELLQIVCGAPNARAGLVAPLALVGAQIGALTITAAKLRGVASNGMLCSAKELGLDSDASGLFELPDDAPVGQALAEYLGLPDASIEIKLTPNRADCFSVRGIAFDVAAACASAVVAFEAGAVAPVSTRTLAVELHAGNAAPRYCGRVIEGIDPAAKTPVWLAERLRRSGVRPVSLLVDITQYVMLELGQPMHAFDLDTLQGPIGVRHSRSGEQLALLDGRQVTLDDSFLTITDADRPVALAGLMGGLDTRVTETTRNVFLESAYFDPAAIMGRGRKFGLHTDAGHRFERGVDPALPPQAIEVATRLVLELAGGTPGPVVHAQLPEHLPQPARILLRRARIARVLGIQIDDAEVVRILSALGMQLEAVAEGWQVMAPSRRFDIAIEEDLIEELARIHGYDRVPTTLPGGASRIAMPSETQLDELSVRRQLVARELQETINYAFVDATLLERWQLTDGLVPLANPLSAELAIMRPRLLPGLVATLGRNAARQAGRVRLFELGKVFAAASDAGAAPQESQHVAAAVCGDALALQWGEPARKVDFHDLKGDLMALAAASGAVLEFQPSAQPFGHPGRSADIHRDGVCIGWIGQVHPRLAKALDIDVDVIAFELQLTALVKRALPRAGELSRFPSVRRDLAFLVPEEVSWAALSSSVRTTVGPLLREVQLFDRYVGQGVEPGFKSLAMGLILQDNSRTLTDRDVDAVVADVVAVIEREHRARIRS
ncbi:phenylalanine--tRNA ligase subunit beta [Xanthomonas arboricola pv. corylina]|uniref:Phenylalanine--tRNA ligase beta subunit n=2 Tax=Xanthomonas TaxID=338 RepID=A0A2S7CIP9_9XANT|nr:phenylalanine--tRNA ligase subunit beta [Xanthomonas arboricola]MDN0203245.1 phenylalanine--tRNA ligase subunit beta [Xanthomonas arboricola pv. corylina]MDN0216234.1 phenylalanine--tRNA ligase subunit beta [Xanthomonas arboricola pv. corylina]PPU13201.1 phenylalanine--tRNA ligase subunit beta [Xanthomonas arboricola pv. corylina]PPU61447.1 phenylalanine--tRNA ligase subunit beta [Xanthomonas arboricola pv. corylina]CAE6759856.1 Phenylalanine--tRNA ligase beta subunit [Xanthomonas arboricol